MRVVILKLSWVYNAGGVAVYTHESIKFKLAENHEAGQLDVTDLMPDSLTRLS